MRRVTASRMALARECLAWVVLDYDDSPPGARAEEGTRRHAVIEAYLKHGEVVDEPWFATWRERFEATRPPGEMIIEAAFAYDTTTGEARRLESSGHRDYSSARPGEFTCQIDVAFLGDQLVVWDWKSGQDLGSPEESGQLGFQALCVSKVHGYTSARAGYFYCSDVACGPVEVVWDALDLAALEADVDSIGDRLAAGHTEPQRGEHCTDLYCPAIRACPAVHGEAEQIVPLGDVVRGIDTPERLRAWAEAGPRIKRLIEKLDEDAKALVDAHGGAVSLGDGRVYRCTEQSRKLLDLGAVRAELGERAAQFERVQQNKVYRIVRERAQ